MCVCVCKYFINLYIHKHAYTHTLTLCILRRARAQTYKPQNEEDSMNFLYIWHSTRATNCTSHLQTGELIPLLSQGYLYLHTLFVQFCYPNGKDLAVYFSFFYYRWRNLLRDIGQLSSYFTGLKESWGLLGNCNVNNIFLNRILSNTIYTII